MLELSRPDLRLIRCCARPSELDELGRAELCGRIAPDELIVIAPAADAQRVFAEIVAELGAVNEAAIVIDHSDAVHMVAMSGRAAEALARLSSVPMPAEGFVQGPVAGVPCKVFVNSEETLLLAPSTYAHHVRERIRVACADLDVYDRTFSEAVSSARATTL